MTEDPGSLLVALDLVLLMVTTVAAAVLSVLAAVRHGVVLVVLAAVLLAVSVLLAALPPVGASTGVVAVVTVASLVAGVFGGDPLTRLILRRTTFEGEEGSHGGMLFEDGRELLRGGRMIGLLERFAVAGVVVAGFPDALAVVIAIKGVGRFSDLENGAVRERFIVGTLTSWSWAGAAAIVVLLTRS